MSEPDLRTWLRADAALWQALDNEPYENAEEHARDFEGFGERVLAEVARRARQQADRDFRVGAQDRVTALLDFADSLDQAREKES